MDRGDSLSIATDLGPFLSISPIDEFVVAG
jgi:hypothetical protein